eukprot:CAMPEP_0170538796 /NCGR_PEP_ID=MMETSP0209-20121228/103535_1 /TAXON_ID=665100 ORGANISM="Litonotus pictus, Strain P1" /NCGR_SAMPLE_ID=MMETSP0209 /ASSEMBLY_ACC=CAM_ASM_000301 /LENGTH=59 /DNA_ID=CAMNT_0010840575 /DNA_START=1086 /DNA_END=1262 /DNA_ORIENTATION=-
MKNVRVLASLADFVRTLCAYGFRLFEQGIDVRNTFLEEFIKSGGIDLIPRLLIDLGDNH